MTKNEVLEMSAAHLEHCHLCAHLMRPWVPERQCLRGPRPFSHLFPSVLTTVVPELLSHPQFYNSPRILSKVPRCDEYERRQGT